MSGVGEASLVLGIISSIISIVTAAKHIYDAANDASGLPKAFHRVAAKLPIVVLILEQANEYVQKPQVDQSTRDAFGTVLSRCELSAEELREIFARALPNNGSSRVDKYLSAARKIGQGSRVQELIADILQEIGLLLASSSFATQRAVQAVERALADVSASGTSLPVDSSTVSPPRTLQQIRYSDDRTQTRDSDPKTLLSAWLLPDELSISKLATEQKTYMQKRFQNPKTAYKSFQWFFETVEYKQFVKIDSSKVLKIKGSPGCGKSVLMASVIHNLESSAPDSGSKDVLYCYCNRASEQSSSMPLVRVLLAQTLQWATPDMILEVKKSYSVHPVLRAYDTSDIEGNLWRLLRTLLGMRDQKTYIVVDGIDNCAQPLFCARSLIKITTSLASKAHCGLLLSSRLDRRDVFDSKSLQASMAKNNVESFQLDITEEQTRQDLVEFVSYQVSSRPPFLSSPQMIQDKIVASVCSRACGMFLYASLALEDLKGETISSIADIDMTLVSLPADLFNGYKKHLRLPIDSRRGPEAFSWIFWVSSSLTWNEFRSALAIAESGYDENNDILDSCDTFIEHTCGQLVESFGDSEQLRFIHPTVTEFLASDSDSGDLLSIRSGPSMIAIKLLNFLEYSDLPSFTSPITQNPRETIQSYTDRPGRGLYPFAISNWYKYLKLCNKSQNQQLEIQVRRFLLSKSFIRWLKTAVIMSRISHDGQDSVSLTADVVDSVQSWVSDRVWTLSKSKSIIQSWLSNFLDLMLDWGKVIANQPDWIHYLHQQLMPTTSSFRDVLEENDSDQSIIQFSSQPISTKRSEPITWPNRCFATDLEKDLAFTFDEPFISCYHIKTGLMTAEVIVPIPSRVQGPLVVRRGLLSPRGKYLAVLFEALGPSTDPVGNKIREGRRLRLNMATTGFKWAMDDASLSFDLSEFLAHMAVGVSKAEFVVCLLEIRHTGPARTHLFGIPSWATSPVIATGMQAMRWELDDVDILQFTEDSSKLVTAFGTFDIESGQTRKHWQFALGQFYQGGKVSGDLKYFATVLRDIDGHCRVQIFDFHTAGIKPDNLPSHEIPFPGVVHLLAISNHGRFLLLTRREISALSRRARSRDASVPTQQASIGVWDCRDGEWTPLLLLDPKSVNKLTHWNFFPYTFQPTFTPESSAESEVNRVFLCVPSRWKLSGNVRTNRTLNPAESHLLLFESKRSARGFGKNPALKLQLPTTAFSLKKSESSAPRVLAWNPSFDEATVYYENSVKTLDHEQLKTSSRPKSDSNITSIAPGSSVDDRPLRYFSALVMSQTRSATFYVRIAIDTSIITTQNSSHVSRDVDAELEGRPIITYDIFVACLLAGEQQARCSSIKYSPTSMTPQPQINRQFACSPDENSLSFGFLELEISHDSISPTIVVNDTGDILFHRAIECFRLKSHPLKRHISETSAIGTLDSRTLPGYIIFTDSQMNFEDMSPLSVDQANTFIIKGDTSTQESQHVFQVSRQLRSNSGQFEHREATQCEICLFIYDEDTDDITWMLHTTTGGDISASRESIPETAWALHPTLPLLAWLLPGHRLRISNIEGHAAPLTIAESLSIDVESAHAIIFSADGRYVIVQAQESFKNDLMSLQRSRNLWGIILCDLQEGTTIGAALVSASPVSVVARDEVLCTYRLTRDGAVESTTYSLPELCLIQRQYLTFIPDGCCCPTCGKCFDSLCKVSVIEHEGGELAILGHTTVGLGKATMSSEVCQPLMIRITTPPVELNVNETQEAVLVIDTKRLFPALLDDRGHIMDHACSLRADEPRKACIKAQGSDCHCDKCLLQDLVTQDKPLDVSCLPQMETKISDFKLPSGLAVPPEQVEDLHMLSEKAGIKDTCVWEDADQSARDSIARMKVVLGEETFPWDSWADFKEAMEEVKEDFDLEKYMNHMFEPGNCGSGCKIPLFVHTFTFGGSDEPNGLHWSSATTTGWLEEDLVWYYERFFNGNFEGARCWYEFPAYKALGVKMDRLKQDKTAKGKRFRRYFGSGADKQGKLLEADFSDKHGKDVFEKDGMTFDDDLKPMVTGLIMKDIFESMSDLVPGLGQIFEQRMHTMFSQSMIENLMD